MSDQANPKTIPFRPIFAKQIQDPSFCAAYDALEEEFAFAAQIIGAGAKANLTQEELAQRMNTTQSAIARLESGRTALSTTTLRKFGKAMGTRLEIRFVWSILCLGLTCRVAAKLQDSFKKLANVGMVT